MRSVCLLLLFLLLAAPCRGQSTDDAQKCADNAESYPDLALHYCTAAIESGRLSDANLAATLNNRGNAYDNKGDYDRAIQDYDQALRLKPDYAEAFNNRGTAYGNKRDYDRAIQDYDQALRLKPDYAEAFNNRGTAYYNKRDYDRAIQDYDQALRLKPDYAHAFNNRGIAYDNKGDYDRAIQDYDQALRLKPDYAEAFNNRGYAYDNKGDYDRAIQDYDQVLRLKPDYALTFYNRGFARYLNGDFTQAQQDLRRAVEMHPTDYPYATIWLYVARARAGADAAGELKQNAARLDLAKWPGPAIRLYLGEIAPTDLLPAAHDSDPKKDVNQTCEANFYLGEYFSLKGRRGEALALFQKASETCPRNWEYTAARAEKRLAQ